MVVEAFVTAVRDNFVAGVCLHIGHQYHACNIAWSEKPYMAQLLVAAVVVEGFYYSCSWTLKKDLHNDFGYNQNLVVMTEKAGIHIDDYPRNIFHDLNPDY